MTNDLDARVDRQPPSIGQDLPRTPQPKGSRQALALASRLALFPARLTVGDDPAPMRDWMVPIIEEALIDAMVLGHGHGQEHALADVRKIIADFQKGTKKPRDARSRDDMVEWCAIHGTLRAVLAEINELMPGAVSTEDCAVDRAAPERPRVALRAQPLDSSTLTPALAQEDTHEDTKPQ